mmetsp:Transcript_7515/g.22260  ORF Transcript_7515/g.22260 Transcript_7515/m.22260 type:complete len:306 (+) Transcript_7515:695-1612(+)
MDALARGHRQRGPQGPGGELQVHDGLRVLARGVREVRDRHGRVAVHARVEHGHAAVGAPDRDEARGQEDALVDGRGLLAVQPRLEHAEGPGVAEARLDVVEAQQALDAGRRERRPVRGEVHALDHVLVVQGRQLLARAGVPDLGRKVARARRGQPRLRAEARGPHGALVARKGADPVARGGVPQHGRAVQAAGDEEVAVARFGREAHLGERPRVPRAHDGRPHVVRGARVLHDLPEGLRGHGGGPARKRAGPQRLELWRGCAAPPGPRRAGALAPRTLPGPETLGNESALPLAGQSGRKTSGDWE